MSKLKGLTPWLCVSPEFFYLPLKRLPKIPRTSLLPIWLPTVRVAELTALSKTLSNTLLVWRPLLLCAARSAAMRSRSAALAARSASLACLASSFALSAASFASASAFAAASASACASSAFCVSSS